MGDSRQIACEWPFEVAQIVGKKSVRFKLKPSATVLKLRTCYLKELTARASIEIPPEAVRFHHNGQELPLEACLGTLGSDTVLEVVHLHLETDFVKSEPEASQRVASGGNGTTTAVTNGNGNIPNGNIPAASPLTEEALNSLEKSDSLNRLPVSPTIPNIISSLPEAAALIGGAIGADVLESGGGGGRSVALEGGPGTNQNGTGVQSPGLGLESGPGPSPVIPSGPSPVGPSPTLPSPAALPNTLTAPSQINSLSSPFGLLRADGCGRDSGFGGTGTQNSMGRAVGSAGSAGPLDRGSVGPGPPDSAKSGSLGPLGGLGLESDREADKNTPTPLDASRDGIVSQPVDQVSMTANVKTEPIPDGEERAPDVGRTAGPEAPGLIITEAPATETPVIDPPTTEAPAIEPPGTAAAVPTTAANLPDLITSEAELDPEHNDIFGANDLSPCPTLPVDGSGGLSGGLGNGSGGTSAIAAGSGIAAGNGSGITNAVANGINNITLEEKTNDPAPDQPPAFARSAEEFFDDPMGGTTTSNLLGSPGIAPVVPGVSTKYTCSLKYTQTQPTDDLVPEAMVEPVAVPVVPGAAEPRKTIDVNDIDNNPEPVAAKAGEIGTEPIVTDSGQPISDSAQSAQSEPLASDVTNEAFKTPGLVSDDGLAGARTAHQNFEELEEGRKSTSKVGDADASRNAKTPDVSRGNRSGGNGDKDGAGNGERASVTPDRDECEKEKDIEADAQANVEANADIDGGEGDAMDAMDVDDNAGADMDMGNDDVMDVDMGVEMEDPEGDQGDKENIAPSVNLNGSRSSTSNKDKLNTAEKLNSSINDKQRKSSAASIENSGPQNPLVEGINDFPPHLAGSTTVEMKTKSVMRGPSQVSQPDPDSKRVSQRVSQSASNRVSQPAPLSQAGGAFQQASTVILSQENPGLDGMGVDGGKGTETGTEEGGKTTTGVKVGDPKEAPNPKDPAPANGGDDFVVNADLDPDALLEGAFVPADVEDPKKIKKSDSSAQPKKRGRAKGKAKAQPAGGAKKRKTTAAANGAFGSENANDPIEDDYNDDDGFGAFAPNAIVLPENPDQAWKCQIKNCKDTYAKETGYSTLQGLFRHYAKHHPNSDHAAKCAAHCEILTLTANGNYSAAAGWKVKGFLVEDTGKNRSHDLKMTWEFVSPEGDAFDKLASNTKEAVADKVSKAGKEAIVYEGVVSDKVSKAGKEAIVYEGGVVSDKVSKAGKEAILYEGKAQKEVKAKLEERRAAIAKDNQKAQTRAKAAARVQQSVRAVLATSGEAAARRKKTALDVSRMDAKKLSEFFLHNPDFAQLRPLAVKFSECQLSGAHLTEWAMGPRGKIAPVIGEGEDGIRGKNGTSGTTIGFNSGSSGRGVVRRDLLNQILGEMDLRDLVLKEILGVGEWEDYCPSMGESHGQGGNGMGNGMEENVGGIGLGIGSSSSSSSKAGPIIGSSSPDPLGAVTRRSTGGVIGIGSTRSNSKLLSSASPNLKDPNNASVSAPPILDNLRLTGQEHLQKSASQNSSHLQGQNGQNTINRIYPYSLCPYGQEIRILSLKTSAVLVRIAPDNTQIPELVHLGRISEYPERRPNGVKIGRAGVPGQKLDLALQTPDYPQLTNGVSRNHANIRFVWGGGSGGGSTGNENTDLNTATTSVEGRWYITDTSTAGTFVAGTRIIPQDSGPFRGMKSAPLRDGDTICFGGDTPHFNAHFAYLFRVL